MKIFSYRHRRFPLGPLPHEKLRRAQKPILPAGRPARRPVSTEGGSSGGYSLGRPIARYAELYANLRDGPVAPAKAPIPDDIGERAANMKSVGYFLDCVAAGTGRMPDDGWTGNAEPGHLHAIVLLFAYARDRAPGRLAGEWIAGTQQARADLGAAEAAVVIAGYIRTFGYAAKAHIAGASDVDIERMVIEAGLGLPRAGGSANPFLGRRFGAAVVTTELEIAHDGPLAELGLGGWLRAKGPGYWLGAGGARPGWKRLRGDHRPLTKSRFPMEKIRRTPRPSTIVEEDKIPRIPLRANFFHRATAGDLGDKAQAAWSSGPNRFAGAAWKYPLARAMMMAIGAHVPHQDGPVSQETAPGTDDPRANAEAVKALAYYMGGDMAGICEAKPFMWYSHDLHGKPIDPDHKYVVAILIDQGHETMEGASGDDWISATQSMRGYLHGAHMAGVIAAHIRSLGYGARTHTVAHEGILHIPAILYSGLGELSRIGELVLNPYVGPRFKSVMITTDMPLETDRPIDFGLQDFCNKCVKCARECPCHAIPLRGKVMFNGYEMWKPDVEKCTRYRLTNPFGSMCGRCMKTCPFNIEGVLTERVFLWAAINLPWTRKWIARLDDKLGNGAINKTKKWWWDLEIAGNEVVKPKGVHERGLHLDDDIDPKKQTLALYPRHRIPAPDAGAAPVDRKQGVADYDAAETALAARKRLGVSGVG